MIKLLFFMERLSFNGAIGGAEKVLCTLVNHMDKEQFDITVSTVFPDEASEMLASHIAYRPMFSRKTKLNQYRYRVEAALGVSHSMHLKGNYDIEAAYLEYGPTKVIASSRNKKAKKLAWVHCDFETAIQDKERFRIGSGKYYDAMNRVICVSEKTRDSFLDIFGMDRDAVVLHNVIDDQEIREKAQQPLPESAQKKKLTLLMVGRFFPQKNYPRLLKAAKRLRDEKFDFDLWIVGDGVDRPLLEGYIQDNYLEDTVTLWGFQKNPYPFMQAADLLVCSSNFEGYSTFVTEGIILKKPILTTDCSGMRELLGDSECGVIVPNDDEAFFNGLRDILSNAEEKLPALTAAVEKRSNDFKMEKLVKDTEDFFRDLLTGN